MLVLLFQHFGTERVVTTFIVIWKMVPVLCHKMYCMLLIFTLSIFDMEKPRECGFMLPWQLQPFFQPCQRVEGSCCCCQQCKKCTTCSAWLLGQPCMHKPYTGVYLLLLITKMPDSSPVFPPFTSPNSELGCESATAWLRIRKNQEEKQMFVRRKRNNCFWLSLVLSSAQEAV